MNSLNVEMKLGMWEEWRGGRGSAMRRSGEDHLNEADVYVEVLGMVMLKFKKKIYCSKCTP